MQSAGKTRIYKINKFGYNMVSDLEKYKTFFDFIKKGHYLKARDFQRENPFAIEEASKSREGRRLFRSIPMRSKKDI